LGRWESSGIIPKSYIKSLTISRSAARTVNRQGDRFFHNPKKLLPTPCLRCDMAKSVTSLLNPKQHIGKVIQLGLWRAAA
jgi:hypothetical protein